MSFNIAIDGPAGAGKSTIAKQAAKALGFVYVDTGAMYRALGLFFMRKGIAPECEEKIIEALDDVDVSIRYMNGEQQVILNGEDVSGQIRTEAVGNMASSTSGYPKVREKLLELQQTMAATHDVIMDGRDIGTNILPDADIKIYLTASADERASRRCKEYDEKGISYDYEKVRQDIIERDERDKNRETAPLRQAEDAVYLDTSDMNIQEVVDYILNLYREKCDSCR